MHSSRMHTARSSRHPPPARSPSTSPLGVGLDQIPLNFPLGHGPGPDSPQLPLGYGPGDPPPQPDPPKLPPWVWAWNNKKQECIPVGCVLPAEVGTPLPDPPQHPPWVWAWTRSPLISPLAMGLDQIPHDFPLDMGLETPSQIPLNFPLGFGPGNLQGMLGYHLQCMLG